MEICLCCAIVCFDTLTALTSRRGVEDGVALPRKRRSFFRVLWPIFRPVIYDLTYCSYMQIRRARTLMSLHLKKKIQGLQLQSLWTDKGMLKCVSVLLNCYRFAAKTIYQFFSNSLKFHAAVGKTYLANLFSTWITSRTWLWTSLYSSLRILSLQYSCKVVTQISIMQPFFAIAMLLDHMRMVRYFRTFYKRISSYV